MSDAIPEDLPGVDPEDRTYLAVLEVASRIATTTLSLPATVITDAIDYIEKALADDGDDAPPEALADARRQLAFLRVFATFRSELDQFTEAAVNPPPSDALRPPGQVSRGGVVLP